MTHAINWFEIPVTDLDRAQNFYQTVLDRALQRENFGGGVLAVFPYEQPDAGGCLRPVSDTCVVQQGQPYAFDMGNGFVPWRRDVRYATAAEAPIAPLLDTLQFVENPKRWGAKFCFGLFEVSAHDLQLIARAMQADMQSLDFSN